VRVLTWNLWWRSEPRDERVAAIEATLRRLEPDVCALQEVWSSPDEGNLAARLGAALQMHWAWEFAQSQGKLEIGNAILSRWPIAEERGAGLPSDGLPDGPRTALAGILDHPRGRLPVFSTQLHSLPTGSAARCRQVAALVELVARTPGDLLPVVCGDLNAEPESDEVRLLEGLRTAPAVAGLGLVDVWRYAPPGDPGWTWDPINPHVAAAFDVSARIDYILIGAAPGPRRVRRVSVAGNEPVDGVWPSDHFAVLAEVSPSAGSA
jgi:endonuclease/exonuclease/phosphatase family metal-dependent hydrolase